MPQAHDTVSCVLITQWHGKNVMAKNESLNINAASVRNTVSMKNLLNTVEKIVNLLNKEREEAKASGEASFLLYKEEFEACTKGAYRDTNMGDYMWVLREGIPGLLLNMVGVRCVGDQTVGDYCIGILNALYRCDEAWAETSFYQEVKALRGEL